MHIALAAKWAHEAHTGVGIYALELARWLSRTPGVRLTLIDRAGARRFTDFPHELATFRAMPGPLWIVSQNNAIQRIAQQADLVHEPYLGVNKALPIPGVVTIHDTIPLDYPDGAPAAFRYYFRNVMPKVVDEAAAVLVNSQTTANDVARHFATARTKIHIVTHGADRLVKYAPVAPLAGGAAEKPTVPYFLAVGTGPMKNVGLTLEAFRRVREESRLPVRMKIVGQPPRSALERLQRWPDLKEAADFVSSIGETQLARLYAAALATVHPAIHEGFGLVPLESMRLGTPAIVSGRGAIPDLCADAATVVEIHDPQPLADAMLDILFEGVHESRIRRGIQLASRYTWQSCAAQAVRVYDRVLGVSREDELAVGPRRAAATPA